MPCLSQWTRTQRRLRQLVLTLEPQVGRRALERLLDGLLGILAEIVVLKAVSAGRGV